MRRGGLALQNAAPYFGLGVARENRVRSPRQFARKLDAIGKRFRNGLPQPPRLAVGVPRRNDYFLFSCRFPLTTYADYATYAYMKTTARLPEGKMFWQVRIDEKLHRQFKVRCVQIGKSMNDQIAELIRAWLKKAS